ncbi:MAG: redoxin domain-containing protein [Phycisphaerales bacterium]|nr:redoxin domain-containing protein [Phycisphaerales bacterium]
MAIGGLALGAAAYEPPKDAPKDSAAHKDHAKVTAKVGEKAPDFTLTDVDGKSWKLSDATKAGKIVVLEWYNPDCPVIVAHHKDAKTFNELHTNYSSKGVMVVAINSSAEGKQGFGKERNAESRKEYGIEYPILLDAEGAVGHMYGAKTTPHVYIVNKDGVLAYAGAIDNQKKDGKVNYAKAALDELLAGKAVTTAETKPYGCGVKYSSK